MLLVSDAINEGNLHAQQSNVQTTPVHSPKPHVLNLVPHFRQKRSVIAAFVPHW